MSRPVLKQAEQWPFRCVEAAPVASPCPWNPSGKCTPPAVHQPLSQMGPSSSGAPQPAKPSGGAGTRIPGAGIPLIQKPDGTWTSSNPEWAHLIDRESGGRNIIQSPSTHDVNSGGNEAFGIFQITPGTWSAHGGQGNVYNSTPQQQAEVAADIIRSNPSGSDWGAGLPGRENPQGLRSI